MLMNHLVGKPFNPLSDTRLPYKDLGSRAEWWKIEHFRRAQRVGLVFGDMAALQDESADGKQEQEDKREVEFGAAELADH
jgi:hypothetical protein